ncbi:probable methyltransferase PMT19 [Ricinus communis]|uniref:Methyltransferase n=1 Tax=Ricinus communis TaxID=3988 RepID=B9SX25_RICCO|nr:probable methyltransferase PMT19 [Ricinus communis]XP_015581702.1 probable methyltransferase PMT19 [Ricinus communis]EEF31835.1 S-adenosylmethionine-dependent methyltransferase, putative [Ricinus communis]|eukprot:XP_002530544.1 probable methyltransferase PMT19 [Ricinus communis]
MARLILFKSPFLKVFLCIILLSLAYILGIQTNLFNSTSLPPPPLAENQSQPLNCVKINFTLPHLDFGAHHTLSLPEEPTKDPSFFSFCPPNFTDYCPCHDPSREMHFTTERFFNRERHCPEPNEKSKCLIPKPIGYKKPFSWPKSRDYAWFNNVPFKKLTELKKSQNWVRLEGDLLVFPGGGTSFKKGVKGYVDDIRRIVPLKSGSIRTVLDVGCGVASFGAFLMNYNILTMSIAPRDIHEAQVQFALERGLPAMLGILSHHRLPFPSRSFDMAHCSRCLVQWTDYDGLYLIEIDRVLRPGGYWVLSGPPINWKAFSSGWERSAQDLKQEQNRFEDLARRLCWRKVEERGPVAVWQKPTNHMHCIKKSRTWKSPSFCINDDPDAGWYKKMEPCITPLPNVTDIHDISGGALEKWPKRLNIAPPRIRSQGISVRVYEGDNQLWKRRLGHYEKILKSLSEGRYRNIMDMNAGIGGFAAALIKYPVWVMNCVPFDAKNNLSIVYERGLIGTYMNWCEAFDTYPRTYDLVHAYGLFSMYMNKCDIVDILLEIHRILRPEGAVLIRDHVDVIMELKDTTNRLRWNGKVFHSENGPLHPEKMLLIDNSN